MKCPQKVLCLTFWGTLLYDQRFNLFSELLPKIPFYLLGTVFQTKILIFFVQPFHKLKEDSGFSKRAATKAFCEASFM